MILYFEIYLVLKNSSELEVQTNVWVISWLGTGIWYVNRQMLYPPFICLIFKGRWLVFIARLLL